MSISAIIPTRNRATLLPRAVASVQAQDWPQLEVVIIDDGSTDDTPRVIDALKARAPVVAIRQANAGDAAARNAGLHAATGDWIAFLDDDDTWRPGKLHVQAAALERTGAQACCGMVAMPHGTKPAAATRLLSGRCAAAFLRGEQSAAITSLLVSRDVAARVGEFDTSLPIGSDMEWIARLCHEAEFCAVPEVVADYNQSPDGLSRYVGIDQLIGRDKHDLRVVQLIAQRCGGKPAFRLAAWQAFATRTYDRCARHLMYAGQLDAAKGLIEAGEALGAGLAHARRKLMKAKVLALAGRRLRHPKFDNPDAIAG